MQSSDVTRTGQIHERKMVVFDVALNRVEAFACWRYSALAVEMGRVAARQLDLAVFDRLLCFVARDADLRSDQISINTNIKHPTVRQFADVLLVDIGVRVVDGKRHSAKRLQRRIGEHFLSRSVLAKDAGFTVRLVVYKHARTRSYAPNIDESVFVARDRSFVEPQPNSIDTLNSLGDAHQSYVHKTKPCAAAPRTMSSPAPFALTMSAGVSISVVPAAKSFTPARLVAIAVVIALSMSEA